MRCGKTEFMPLAEVRAALASARPGEVVVYARGYLARDRVEQWSRPSWNDLRCTAGHVYEQNLLGRVCLTQRRLDDCRWEYRATVCGERIAA